MEGGASALSSLSTAKEQCGRGVSDFGCFSVHTGCSADAIFLHGS